MRTFTLNKHDIKRTWSVIKDTLQKKFDSALPNKCILNNIAITDMDTFANELKRYSIHIGRSASD